MTKSSALQKFVRMQRVEVSREKMSLSLNEIKIVAADDYEAILVA